MMSATKGPRSLARKHERIYFDVQILLRNDNRVLQSQMYTETDGIERLERKTSDE